MKKILFLLMAMVPVLCFGQIFIPDGKYGTQHIRAQKDSVDIIPKGLTGSNNGKRTNIFGKDTAQIRYRVEDSSVYVHTGFQWLKIVSGASASFVDSVTFSPSQNVDTVKYWIAGTGYVAGVVDVKCGLIQPGTIVHDSLLSFTVSPSIHRSCEDGIRYTTVLTHLTLSPADATFDRYDVIALEEDQVIVVEGDPSATPVLPQLTSGQTYLTFISIPATATAPAGVSTSTIYDENVEFTVSSSGVTVNANNATNVQHLLKSLDAGSFGILNTITFTGADFKISNYNALRFYVKLKSSFANATRFTLSWLRDGIVQSSVISIQTGHYGFTRTNTSTYQEIIIPISDFSFSQDTVDALRVGFTGSNANGFYMDWVTLTGGIDQNVSPHPNSFGLVSTSSGSAVSTQPNDVLNIVGAGGITTSATGKTVTITGGGSTPTLDAVTAVGNTSSADIVAPAFSSATSKFVLSMPGGNYGQLSLANIGDFANVIRPQAASTGTIHWLPNTGNTNDTLATLYDLRAGAGTPNWDAVLAQGGTQSATRKYNSNNNLLEFDSASRYYFQTKRVSNKHSYFDLSPDYITLQTNGVATNTWTGLFTDISTSGIYAQLDGGGYTQFQSNYNIIKGFQKNAANATIDIDFRLIQLPTGNGTKQIRYDDATGRFYVKDTVVRSTHSKALTIEFPTSSESFGVWKTPVDITISSVEAVLVGSSSPSVTFQIVFGSDRTSGTNVYSSGRTATSTTTGHTFNSSFNDATIPAGSFIWFTTSAQSGTVTNIEVTINYTED